MQVQMTDGERQAFESFAKAAGSYFEYGMGGSTILASNLVKGPITAIDSSKEWLLKVQASIGVSAYTRNLRHVDIGPIGNWGFPKEEGSADKFKYYYNAIAEHNPSEVDFCLVDGRFRVACFLSTLKYVRPDTIISIHDYRNRKHYHVAENYGRIIFEVEAISFFIRRRDASLVEIENAIQRYGSISL